MNIPMKLIKSFKIAYISHKGQKDKGGKPYIFHPINVMLGTENVRYYCVALLHDVLEDSDKFTLNDFDFLDEDEKDALILLKHDKEVDYFDYINQIAVNKISRTVKLSDLRHNSNLKRIKNITEKDKIRLKKYKKAIEILKG